MKCTRVPRRTTIIAIALSAIMLSGCIPLALTGVGAGALVATDRRSTGAQLDDEIIEDKIVANVADRFKGDFHVNATSYNAVVLLTGEVPSQSARNDVEQLARGTPKARAVQDELVVGPVTDLGSRSNDTFITSKVKARFVEANKFAANHVKVVTERGVVYLMGLVRHAEADAAADISRTTKGAQRVVRLFEYID